MVPIVRAVFAAQVQEGMKKDALAEHYGLPVSHITAILKELGLTIRKFHRPKYTLVDTVEEAEAITGGLGETDDLVPIPETAKDLPLPKPQAKIEDDVPVLRPEGSTPLNLTKEEIKSIFVEGEPEDNGSAMKPSKAFDDTQTNFNIESGATVVDATFSAEIAQAPNSGPGDINIADSPANIFKKQWGK